MTRLRNGPSIGTPPDASPPDPSERRPDPESAAPGTDAADRHGAHRPTRDELLRSRDELARRVEADRALHEIAAQIAALRDTDDLLQDVVEHARRLTGSDGAHLTLRVEGSADLRPYVMAGAMDEASRAWLRGIRLEPGSGTNALAAELGEPIVTSDFRVDQRLPHGPGGGTAARRMAMVAIAAVPMRGANGEVIGTLSISYEAPHDFEPQQIDVLQAFADQAAIAVANARLYERLRRSEEQYRFLVERAPDLLFSTDAEGRFTFLSDTSERLTGWRPDELVGRPFLAIVDATSQPDVRAALQAMMAAPGAEARFRFLQLRRDGAAFPVESSVRPIVVDGLLAGAQGITRDVTEFDRVEQDRRLQAAELAVAQERAHLARELHDSVTQALFSMTLQTSALEVLLGRGDAEGARARLVALTSLQRDALAEMRALIFALRPPSVEQDGLVQALRSYVTALGSRSDLRFSVEAEDVARPDPAVEDALYRIAQEALHNVTKHAQASSAVVRVVAIGDEIHLEVADDGIGFDQSAVPAGHLGVAGMRARAGLIGGRLEIESGADRGTVVRVTAPRRGRALGANGAAGFS